MKPFLSLLLLSLPFSFDANAAYSECVVICSVPNAYGANRCHVWGYDGYGVPKRINTQNWDTDSRVSLDTALEALRRHRGSGNCTSTGSPVVSYHSAT